MRTVASQPLAAVSRHPKRPPAVSVGPAAPCPCLLPCCTPAMLPTEALIAKESRGEGLGSLSYSYSAFPSRERGLSAFFLSRLPFWVSWHAFLQLRCSHPSRPPNRFPAATAPTPPCSCTTPRSPFLPGERQKQYQEHKRDENAELGKNIEYFPCWCS